MKKKRAISELFVINLNKLELNKWFFLFMLPVLILCYTSVYSFLNSTDFVYDEVYYSELGSIDYKVFYYENDYYSDYLNDNMTYVADLIDYIEIDFNYQMNIEEEIDLEYDYDIIATLVITNKDQEDEILYNEETVLVENEKFSVIDNNFVLKENIVIDYSEYNEYVNEYKQNYSLSVSSYVIISMNINSMGTYSSIEKNISEDSSLIVNIPLTEQTIGVTVEENYINTSNSITGNKSLGVTNLFLIVISFIALIFAIYFFILAIKVLKVSKIDKDKYNKTIKKYLREYDKIIVNSKNPNINRDNYKNIIKISTIEELIDAYDSVRKPIIFYEIIKNVKSTFIIIDEETLYEFIVEEKDFI